MVVVVVTVAVIVVYHHHYWHLTLWLVAWRVSACVKLEISIPMQMTMGQSSDRPHFILESQCVRCCCVNVYVRYYTCKSITTQHRSLPQGCLRVVGGFAGSKIVTPTPTCGHPYL